jgi:hypothetical protein
MNKEEGNMDKGDRDLLEASVRRVDGFGELSFVDQTAFLVYLLTVTLGAKSVTGQAVEAVRSQLKLAPGASAKYLSIHSKGKSKRFLKRNPGYVLTRTEEERIALSLGRATAVTTSISLRQHMAGISDADLRAYLDEAVGSFEHGFFRAAIVMSWCAAFSVFRDWIFNKNVTTFNAQTATWKKPKSITVISDLDELSERVIIDTAKQASVISSNEHKVLVHLLDQRNAYAHPSGRSVSAAVSEAFVQQVIDEVLKKYG